MDQQQRESIGAEIARIRKLRPRITVSELADAAELAPNTVGAVIRGVSNDESVGRVLAALKDLGRPVEVVAASQETSLEVGRASAQLMADLVRTFLNSAPPEEAQEMERRIWLVLRGKLDELVEIAGTSPEQ